MQRAVAQFNSQVSEQELPEGFHDATPEEQNAVLSDIISTKKAQAMMHEVIAPLQQQQQQQEMSAKLDSASVSWAQQRGAPGAANEIRTFIGTFPPEQIQMLEAEMEAGGGPFSGMVGQHVDGIAAAHTRAAEKGTEEELPKSEDVGGGESDDGGLLTGEAQSFMAQARADGIMNKSQLADLEKTLVENL